MLFLRSRIVRVAIVLVIVAIGFGIRYWREWRDRIPQQPSVVVMPAKVTGSEDMSFLTDAVSNSLSAHLSAIPGLETKVPPTSFEVEPIGDNYKRISQAYGVNLIVGTGIAVESDQLQLDLHLIDPVSQRVLWTDSFQGTKDQYLDLMERAREALRQTLRVGDAAPAATDDAGSSEAELAYQAGEYHLNRYSSQHDPADFAASLKSFQQALELNPKLANAASGLSRLYGMQIEVAQPNPELLAEVEKWARRALEIDDKNGRAFFMLSSAESWRPGSDPMRRLPDALRAAKFAPDFAAAHLELGQAMAASTNLGLAASRRSRQLDPLYFYAPLAEAGYLHQLGRTSEAFGILDRYVLSIDPNMGYGRWVEASLMIELGWLEKAEHLVKEIEKDVSEQRITPLASNTIRQKYAIALKEFGSAGIEITRIMKVVDNPKVTPLEMTVAVESVPALANGGYLEDALHILERAAALGIVLPYDWLRTDRRLEKLRRVSRFSFILERSRAQFEQMLKVLDEAGARGELPNYLELSISELRSSLPN